jgi:glycosyltransferase involved in cell wall biosynthesis
LQKSQDLVFVYEPSPITVGIPALVFKLFSNAPLLFWIQDLWPESLIAAGNMNSRIVLNTIEKLVKLIYKKSDYLFISSRSFEQSIINKGVPKNKILYLPNWAEDIYTNSVLSNEAVLNSLPPGGFKIMFAGNVGESQDFESIVNAAEQTLEFEDIQWIVLGDGRKKKWVEQQIQQRKLHNIFLIGRKPMTEMPAYFKEADVMLVSLKDELIFRLTVPAKVQSYLACGKPILAMMNGEGADIIKQSHSGFAVSAGDFRSLAEKAIILYKMPKNELNAMANSSKEYYFKNFDRRELIDELISVFYSVIQNKNCKK